MMLSGAGKSTESSRLMSPFMSPLPPPRRRARATPFDAFFLHSRDASSFFRWPPRQAMNTFAYVAMPPIRRDSADGFYAPDARCLAADISR